MLVLRVGTPLVESKKNFLSFIFILKFGFYNCWNIFLLSNFSMQFWRKKSKKDIMSDSLMYCVLLLVFFILKMKSEQYFLYVNYIIGKEKTIILAF